MFFKWAVNEEIIDDSPMRKMQAPSAPAPTTPVVTPEQFKSYKRLGEEIGFRHVESGPLVRSSYHAEEQVLSLDEPPR